ncbi:MAG: Hsp20/alpha crystallin family protein [Candidatus Bathyarchaeia archaeon]|jgi:HSP20 family protein|nr:Hsp20/alpha crystallin family protein [Candidatus Bathyarchaeota archaeon]
MVRKGRWLFDYFDEIEREIEEAFEELFYGRPMWDSSTGRLEPLTEVTETLDKIVVTMDLPLVRKENIHLTIEEDYLKLEAPLERTIRFERWGIIPRHCEFKSFYKIVELPAKVNPEEAKARFKNGVLSVELPKIVRGHKIPVE